jgi:hypothetical protein
MYAEGNSLMKECDKANGTNNNENRTRHWLDAYDRVFQLFLMNNDNHFRRTQILMLAIQAAIFTGFGKAAWDPQVSKILLKLASLGVIPILGLISACIWFALIGRQRTVFEFYRCYLRYIECHLMRLGVPLACFRAESFIFWGKNYVEFDDCENNSGNSNSKSNFKFQTKFPYNENKHKAKIGMMRLEEILVSFLFSFWSACLLTFFVYTIFGKLLSWSLPCFLLPIVFISTFLCVECIMLYRLKQKKTQKPTLTIPFWELANNEIKAPES